MSRPAFLLAPPLALLAAACATGEGRPDGQSDFYAGLSSDGRTAAEIAFQAALEKNVSGEQAGWKVGEDSFGYLTPIETWESQSGHWCRRFAETVQASGASRDRQAVACRVDGRWRMTEV